MSNAFSLSAADLGQVPYALRTFDLAKAFGPTQAVRSCTFDLRAGEVHAIMGENGSGKSTLVKLLAGVHRPDRGAIEIGEHRLTALRSPRRALEHGIVTVFQEVLVVPARSILENVWLGMDSLARESATPTERVERATATLEELTGSRPDLDRPVEELSLSDRQACCIARALIRRPRALILDESTSALDVATRDRLFAILRRLSAAGTSTIFISHRMDEVQEIADRITVMRSGETVSTTWRGEVSAAQLVRSMTGAEHLTDTSVSQPARVEPGAVVLKADGIRLRPGGAPIDFELRAGEIVGLAGLEGQGQDGFLRSLLRASHRERIAYVPRERRDEALFPVLSVRDNFALPTARRDTRVGILRRRATDRRLAGYVERLGIKLGAAGHGIMTLSGGNQQKVVIARWLAAEPRILLLNDPTRGVDLGAKRDIYDLLAELTAQGIAIVMLSTEVDELVELMDRVLVFRDGELAVELGRAQLDRQTLVASYFGRAGADG
jgi:ABC-type sugar transport system ATPase subunit